MRILGVAAILVLLLSTAAQPQQKQAPSKSGWKCGSRVDQLPYYYEEAALENIEPPEWRHGLIRISVGTETRMDLWTDGETFKLWTMSILFRGVDTFLLGLNKVCRLPMEPDHASDLIKVKWESVDLTAAQFEQIHQDFTSALAQYDSGAQARYGDMIATKMRVDYVDTSDFRIVYDNSHEHIEAGVWNDPAQNKPPCFPI